jgi:hypothetical protein
MMRLDFLWFHGKAALSGSSIPFTAGLSGLADRRVFADGHFVRAVSAPELMGIGVVCCVEPMSTAKDVRA